MTPPSFAVAPASLADLAALHALIERAYRGDSARAGWTHEADLLTTPRTSLHDLQAIVNDPDALLLAVRLDGEMVGCVQLARQPSGAAYIGLLTVDPLRQAGGLGKLILTAAEVEARRRFGADVVELSVVSRRAELIAYYERRGYVATGETRPFPVPVDPPLELAVFRKALEACA